MDALFNCLQPWLAAAGVNEEDKDDTKPMKPSICQFESASNSSIYDSVIDTIGRTPIIQLQNMLPKPETADSKTKINLFVKLESQNPAGSIKDRLAIGVIEWAEKHGHLKRGQTVIEASSGNTGIGLACVCAAKGYPFVCVMSESFSLERRKRMRFCGAKVILTNPAHKGTGMVIKCQELAEKHGYFWPNQFENEANAWIHEHTTGPEITKAFRQKFWIESLLPRKVKSCGLDHFVCAYGTGGTALGVGRYLKEHSPHTKIHVCEPSNAPMLYSKIPTKYPTQIYTSEEDKEGAEGDKGPSTSFDVPHPVWRPHLLQGWATDFIPKLLSTAKEEDDFDSVLHVGGDDAIQTAKDLATKEGIFSGTSGGGTVSAAIQLAKELLQDGKDHKKVINILAVVADTGERYMSTPLFEGIPTDMTEEEKELALSTPSQAPPAPGLPDPSPSATKWVKQKIKAHQVVIFSLEYCEFCWTLTRFFDALGVPYHKIDIDSFEYAENNRGNTYRASLQEMTDCKTFPQWFLDGEFLGGAVDACMMWKKTVKDSNELSKKLRKAGIKGGNGKFNDYEGDAFEFLPKWMTQNPLRTK